MGLTDGVVWQADTMSPMRRSIRSSCLGDTSATVNGKRGSIIFLRIKCDGRFNAAIRVPSIKS